MKFTLLFNHKLSYMISLLAFKITTLKVRIRMTINWFDSIIMITLTVHACKLNSNCKQTCIQEKVEIRYKMIHGVTHEIDKYHSYGMF